MGTDRVLFFSPYCFVTNENLIAVFLHPSPIGFLFKPNLTCSYEVSKLDIGASVNPEPHGQWRTQSQVRFSTEVDYTQLIRSIHHGLGLLKNHDFDWLLLCWEIFFPTSSIPFLTENSNFQLLQKYHYLIPLSYREPFFYFLLICNLRS